MQKRITLVYSLLLLIISLLTLRLYVLSNGNKSSLVLDGQYTRRVDIANHTGFVYDRNLNLLSHTKQNGVVFVVPEEITLPYATLCQNLSEICTNANSDEIFSLLMDNTPFKLTTNDEKAHEKISQVDGAYYYDTYEKSLQNALHLVGYTNKDGKGVCGLEKQYADVLDYFESEVYAVYESNASKAKLADGFLTFYDNGYSKNKGLVTTIDKQIQEFTDSLEGEYIQSGAVVVTNVQSGEIVALSSYPQFDLQNLSASLDSENGEFLNRALCTFTPGSVFKIVSAVTALEMDESLYDFEYECTGKVEVEQNIFHCHKRGGHGNQTLKEAFANSCNTYFIELVSRVGLESVVHMCEKIGVGQEINIDGIKTQKANIPSADNASASFVANISFGQGPLLLSPVDMANIMCVCTTGKIIPLSVIKGTFDGEKIEYFEKLPQKTILKQSTVLKMREMMRLCVTDGTGKSANVKAVSVGGKTATAQTGLYYEDGTEKLHTWFCGIIGINSPKYSIIIFCDANSRNNKSPAEIFSLLTEKIINWSK